MVSVLKDTSEFDAEIAKLESEMDEIGVLTESLIGRNASVAISQDEYNRQYDAYTGSVFISVMKHSSTSASKARDTFLPFSLSHFDFALLNRSV